MERQKLIEQLDQVQYNIKITEKFMAQSIPPYYTQFNKLSVWEHKLEIWSKSLAFWKRKFNRIIDELRYD